MSQCFLRLFFPLLIMFIDVRDGDGEERTSTHWFSPQMLTIAWPGPELGVENSEQVSQAGGRDAAF